MTDPGFARRIRDVMKHDLDFSLNDVHLLKMGRHFRFSPELKLVVGRTEEENQKIQTFAHGEDIVFNLAYSPGPLSLLRGKANEDEIRRASAITVRYSKMKDSEKAEVVYKKLCEDSSRSMVVSPASEIEIKEWIIS